MTFPTPRSSPGSWSTTIYQALALFEAADAFLMPYSNSAFLPMTIPRPGVFHGVTGWFTEVPFPIVKRRDPVLTFPVTGPPCPAEVQGGDRDPSTLDYDLDVDEVVAAVLEVLRR